MLNTNLKMSLLVIFNICTDHAGVTDHLLWNENPGNEVLAPRIH